MIVVFLTYSGMLLQCMAIVAKKLRVDADKTAAFVKKICLLDCCMQRFRKTLSGETFCYIKMKFCALSNLTYCFYELLLGP